MMQGSVARRTPLAVVALGAILAVTAAWWALALWPLAADAPQWIVTTREVCFGSSPSGLPHAGGWLLLIGEPIGLIAILHIVWGAELRAGLSEVWRTLPGRAGLTVTAVAVIVGIGAAAQRVAAATTAPAEPFALNPALPARSATPAPELALVDQHGGRTRLADFRGQWVLVTFAFGHCDDICPVIVDHARRARRDAGAPEVPLLVVSLDPWRDTPDRLPSIATTWGLEPHDRLLSGSVEEVNATLDAWGIARARDPDTGMVTHGSVVMVIDPAGRLAWRLDGAPQRAREALEKTRVTASGTTD